MHLGGVGYKTISRNSSGITLLDRNVTQVTAVNTTGVISLYTYTVPGGTLRTDRALRLSMFGDFNNSTGGTRGATVILKYGNTTLHTGGPSLDDAPLRRFFRFNSTLMAFNSVNAQVAITELAYDRNGIGSAAGIAGAQVGLGTGFILDSAHYGVVEQSNADQILAVTVQLDVATSTYDCRRHTAFLELLR